MNEDQYDHIGFTRNVAPGVSYYFVDYTLKEKALKGEPLPPGHFWCIRDAEAAAAESAFFRWCCDNREDNVSGTAEECEAHYRRKWIAAGKPGSAGGKDL